MKRIFLFLLLIRSASFATEDVQACHISEDCIVIVEKCGHVGINKSFLKEVKSKKSFHLDNCLGFLDPKRTTYAAACIQGTCEVTERKTSTLKKCVGLLTPDGNITYKEDCLSPSKTLVKKGTYPKGVAGPIDTPERAMELYNKTKNEATTIESEKATDQ